ncbi:MAG: ferrous iron transport protein B [Kiritimatiellae bacterium]|nr:ferrous iron transport protein B [Kiritimatiellia bacterium]
MIEEKIVGNTKRTVPAQPEKSEFRAALGGNPNAGKTTLFNALTGGQHHVANYPGVTVTAKEGLMLHKGHSTSLIDLPGTYSLAAYSPDELVARNYVLDQHPDVVISICDASSLERSLYLAVQFMELRVPMILVLNKSDLAEKSGHIFNIEILERLLGMPIVPTSAHREEGIQELKDAILNIEIRKERPLPVKVTYGREIEAELEQLTPMAAQAAEHLSRDPRWVALKLLEKDAYVRNRLTGECGTDGASLLTQAGEAIGRIEKHFGDRSEIVIADQRYGFISGACQEAVTTTSEMRHDISDRIDDIVTSELLGIPIFLVLMYFLFKLTFTLGAPAMMLIEATVGWLGNIVSSLWPGGTENALCSLLVDGIIGGVGGVLVFLPNIALLFVGIAFLEDSGYMARGAFIMDRFMHKIGLHGRSFIPAVVGFGCTVPAIMATRALENKRDRLTTMLVLPLMSCGARFPIYTLFIAAFFPQPWRAPILMGIYLLGIALAALLAKLLRKTLLKGDTSLFVMELPPYRMPTPRGILSHTWERTRQFIRKASTVIVVASCILWVLTNYPKPDAEQLENLTTVEQQSVELSTSIAGRIGHTIEPIMRPIGFDWKTSTALIGAFAAKEIFVAQLGIVYSLGEADEESYTLRQRLRENYTPLQALCIMIFCLISIPCVATMATMKSESGAWRWPLLQFGGLTLLAYLITLVLYQGGTLLGFESML